MSRKPTIDDVAVEAGVARATVSRVLNSSPNTSARVREKVLRAVATLNYQVNHQARQLASGTTRVLALVFAADAEVEPNSYYHSAIELGAMRTATELGYGLVAHTLDPSHDDYHSKIMTLASQGRCDGIVLTPPFTDDDELIRELQESSVSFVLISAGPLTSSLAPSVGIDDKQAGRDIGAYLYREGHRRFGFIGGPKEHRSAALRLEGLRESLDMGLQSDAVINAVEGNFTFRSGTTLAAELLESEGRPTALVCANDDMAAGALFTAHRLGLSVPADISITGFDDTPVSQIVWPPLTTVHQPLRQMGARAVEILVNACVGPAGNGSCELNDQVVPYELIVADQHREGSAAAGSIESASIFSLTFTRFSPKQILEALPIGHLITCPVARRLTNRKRKSGQNPELGGKNEGQYSLFESYPRIWFYHLGTGVGCNVADSGACASRRY